MSQIETLIEQKVLAKDRYNFYKKFYNSRTPVLIKNGAKDWPLIHKWTKDYLSDLSGNAPCTIVKDSRPAFSKNNTTLKQYFEEQPSKSTLTLQNFNPESYPLYIDDINFPNPYFSHKDIYRFFFYHSMKNEGTLPHNHGDAFNILQSGTKHWVFFDASKTENPLGRVEMMKTLQNYPPGSHARDYFHIELEKLALRGIKIKECIQEAGDIIYIPREYCHAVLNKSEVMGIVFETKLLKK